MVTLRKTRVKKSSQSQKTVEMEEVLLVVSKDNPCKGSWKMILQLVKDRYQNCKELLDTVGRLK